jgi:hypothetical protein
MNKQIILMLLFCLTIFGLARGGPQSTDLSGEQLKWQVITSSGGTAAGGGFTLSSSLGQTAVGNGASGSFHLINGFLQTFGATVAPCTRCGDANNDGSTDISDVVFVIAYIFSGGAAPGECNTPHGIGDANGSGDVDISDVVYLIAYIFSGGLAPHCQ